MGSTTSSCGNGPPVVPTSKAIMLGCIDYTDQIRSIWAGVSGYFQKNGVDFDFVLFTNYDRMVEALLSGLIDIAWNGPLAHVRTMKRTDSKAMPLGHRDVDCGFVTHIIVPKSANITSVAQLQDKRLAAGTRDSPQACVLPMHYLKTQGLNLKSLSVTFFDRDFGKHGDTALGEIDVMNELTKGNFDAGFVSDLMWQRAIASGDVNTGDGEELEILKAAKVPPFNHCSFDALPHLDEKKKKDFETVLFRMDYSKPEDRHIMQLEGIRRKWVPSDEDGYSTVRDALSKEPNIPFPPPMYRAENHPFKQLEVK